MKAITVRDRDAGVGGLSLTDMSYPHVAQNDVIVQVHAGGSSAPGFAKPVKLAGVLVWPLR